jgi:hypothetical protein
LKTGKDGALAAGACANSDADIVRRQTRKMLSHTFLMAFVLQFSPRKPRLPRSRSEKSVHQILAAR